MNSLFYSFSSRKLPSCAICYLCILGSILYAQQPSQQDIDADRNAIMETIDRHYNGVTQQDVSLASQGYAPGLHWVDAKGKTIYSKSSLESHFSELFSNTAPIKVKSRSDQLTYLSETIGVVHSMVLLEEGKFFHLRVFSKQGGEWKIINHLVSKSQP